jgi:FAD/FMN-containing dehydrogenase
VESSTIVEGLRHLVGADTVVDDREVMSSFEIDWTGRFEGRAACVVRPGSLDDVNRIVTWCRDVGVPLVPQGGNTGLVGGSVPDATARSVVLSTRRLDRLRDVDLTAGQVTVEAGVTLAQLDAALVGSGWEFGVDLGARDSATLGGMAATNAGGLRVLRHGTMRANVVGVEAVLGTGAQVSHLDGLVKDNTGYDLAGLLCGSEGTLGVITALRLRLVPRWPDRCALWVACRNWEDAVALATRARLEIDGLDGLEAVDAAGLTVVQGELALPPLFDPTPDVALLVVWAGRGDPPDALGSLVAEHDHVVAQDGPAWRALWAYRERVTEAIARRGVPKKFDVTLPLARLTEFTRRVPDVVDGHSVILFGHLGDGNLHVNLPEADDTHVTLDDSVLRLVAECGGSISAEHGIGRHKAPWLHLNRSDAERDTFRALKAALDPAGVMNPGVLFAE